MVSRNLAGLLRNPAALGAEATGAVIDDAPIAPPATSPLVLMLTRKPVSISLVGGLILHVCSPFVCSELVSWSLWFR